MAQKIVCRGKLSRDVFSFLGHSLKKGEGSPIIFTLGGRL